MNRILLAAIALGLWVNAATTIIRPAHAEHDESYFELKSINNTLKRVVS
jgi:hypothetical protein